jgi:hypothetical protein
MNDIIVGSFEEAEPSNPTKLTLELASWYLSSAGTSHGHRLKTARVPDGKVPLVNFSTTSSPPNALAHLG